MAELAFREGIMDRIRIREPRFDEQAYLFVLSALEMCQAQMSVRRHITGVELARAARDLALEQDTRDEFVDVFDFDLAFERDYPWNCAQQA